MFDGYDNGVLMADQYVGRLLNLLADLSVDQDTVVVVGSDHGENLGEMNVYGDHQTADQITTRIPMIMKWPGVAEGGRYAAMHYHIDVFATLLELADKAVPSSWDGQSFAESLRQGRTSVERSWWCLRRLGRVSAACASIITCICALGMTPTIFGRMRCFLMLWRIHQQTNLADVQPQALQQGRDKLDSWRAAMIVDAARGSRPSR